MNINWNNIGGFMLITTEEIIREATEKIIKKEKKEGTIREISGVVKAILFLNFSVSFEEMVDIVVSFLENEKNKQLADEIDWDTVFYAKNFGNSEEVEILIEASLKKMLSNLRET